MNIIKKQTAVFTVDEIKNIIIMNYGKRMEPKEISGGGENNVLDRL